MTTHQEAQNSPNEAIAVTKSSSNHNQIISYEKSVEYWASQPATVDGMLGGLECVNQADVEQSQKFLDSFISVLVIYFMSNLYNLYNY